MDHVTGCEKYRNKENPDIIVKFEDMELNRLSIDLPFTKQQCEGKTEIKVLQFSKDRRQILYQVKLILSILHSLNHILRRASRMQHHL